MEIKDIGLFMKKEAEMSTGNTVTVDKKFWVEVADLLIETDNNLQQILKEIERIYKEG